MSFRNVLGHEEAIAGLRASLASGRIAPAYLFCGMEGVGRNTLMRAFAAALLCRESPEDACGECTDCTLAARGTHPDLVLLEREKETIPVAEMRAFCHAVSLKPALAGRKACLVPEAGRMTVQAANCILKTLEEPPPRAVLLLRGESTDRLLPTIVSRCQVVRLAPLPHGLLGEELRRRGAAEGKDADALALVGEGSLGKALELSEGEAAAEWEWIQSMLGNLRPGNAREISDELSARAARRGAQELLEMIALALRLRMREKKTSPRGELACLEEVWTAAERLERNVTPDLALRSLALGLGSFFRSP
jgi:DNA polymerase III subunit delta'